MTWEELARQAVKGDMIEVYNLLIAMAIVLDTLEGVAPPPNAEEE